MHSATSSSVEPFALFEALFDQAPVGLAIWDRDLRCVAVNTSFARISGADAEALLGRTPREALGAGGREIEGLLHGLFEGRYPTVDVHVPSAASPQTEQLQWRMTCYPVSAHGGDLAAGVTLMTDLQPVTGAALHESEERFRLLVDGVTDYAILMLDADGRVVSWNKGAERITGYDAQEIIGQHVSRFHAGASSERGEADQLLRIAAAQGRVATENWRVRKDGRRFWASAIITALRSPAGELRGFAKVVRDLTEQREAEDALRLSENTLRSVLQSASDGVIVVDKKARIVSANARAEEMFGYGADELIGEPIEVLVPDRLRDVHGGYRNDFIAAPRARPMGRGLDLTARRKDGSEFPVEVGLGTAHVSETEGPLITAVVTDITQRKEAEEQLAYQATHDSLTGLPNRALFLDRLQQVLRRTTRQGETDDLVAVLFFDLDRFKVINDSLGHEAGDEVLRTVARRLLEIVRPSDTVARFGGDEFAMLCDGLAGPRDAARIAERILRCLSRPMENAHGEQAVSASIGIAIADQPLSDADGLLRDADAAMYLAKRRGKGRFELFDAELRQQANDRLDTENGLRRAIDQDELCLLYQPIVATATRTMVAVEALVRWRHPTRGLLAPHEFIPVAEETGLIVPLGAWVVRQACRQAARWHDSAGDTTRLQMSVNVAARQLADPDIKCTIREALETEGLEPNRLQLEITETELMMDPRASMSALEDLGGLGVCFAVDDFGTGYSSLSRLREFPVNALKIDRSFIDGLGREPADYAIVDAVVGLARSYGITAVAEGVEVHEQEATLSELGCDYAQGFLYSRPAPASRIEALLRSS